MENQLRKIYRELQELKKYLRREDYARVRIVTKSMDKEIKKAINIKKQL